MEHEHEIFFALVEQFKEDYEKFLSTGNKAAGTRARKALSEISKLCKTVRGEIQQQKNSIYVPSVKNS
jgi:hypothetical protein